MSTRTEFPTHASSLVMKMTNNAIQQTTKMKKIQQQPYLTLIPLVLVLVGLAVFSSDDFVRASSTTTTSNGYNYHNNNSTAARGVIQYNDQFNDNKRGWYYGTPHYTGLFSRDVYTAALLSNDVYEDYVSQATLTNAPSYQRVYRHKEGVYVFNAYVSHAEKKVVLSFRGTEMSIVDWGQNLDVILTTYSLQISPVQNIVVHEGFLYEILSYKDRLIQILDLYPHYNIIWTGHSQGGGLAQIAAVILGYERSIPFSSAKVISFGSTHAGSRSFTDVASSIVQHHRIVNTIPCSYLDCFYADIVSDLLSYTILYKHFGVWYPLLTFHAPILDLHSMDNYVLEVRKRLSPYDRIAFSVDLPISIIHQQISRVYYTVSENTHCYTTNLQLTISRDGNQWRHYLGCSQNGYLDISNFQPGVYNLQLSDGLNTFSTSPSQMTISSPPFVCPSTCSNCDSNRKLCTSCLNGFYGPLCQYYCSPNCLSCNVTATSCTTCKNPGTNRPTCDRKCTGCTNGQCVDGRCICNSGYTGINCTSMACPDNCLTCSSPYLCTSCLPRTFGATCSFACIPNCLTCSDDKTCTKCDAGYSGSTCAVGPNSFSSSLLKITDSGFITIQGGAPFKIRKMVSQSSNYFGIANRMDMIFKYFLPTTTFTQMFSDSYYAPFNSISSMGDSFIATTSKPGYVVVYGSPASMPSKTVATAINTGINDTIIEVQVTTYFSFFLTSSGDVHVYGDASQAGSSCGAASGFYGVSRITNFTKLDIPDKISLLSCTYHGLCFAYNRNSRKLYGWGSVLYYYYGGSDICQYNPLELDTTSFGNEIISSIQGDSLQINFVTESGKVYYIGGTNYLPRSSRPTLLTSAVTGTNERIIKATMAYYNSLIITTYSRKNYILGYMYQVINPGVVIPSTSISWGSTDHVVNLITYNSISCNGLYDFDPAVCSGRGTCEYYDMCYCKSGYTGDNCQVLTCGGKRADVSTVCSGVGKCNIPNNCTCPSGFSGPNCEYFESSSNNCLPSTLNCQSCKTGFHSPSQLCKLQCMQNCEQCSSSEVCDKCISGMTGQNCDEKVCLVSNCITCSKTTGLCLECDQRLYGSYCNLTCPLNCKSCISPSECKSCESGWMGQQCEIPICTGNCSECTSPTQCTKCSDGFYGAGCEKICLSSCKSCNNSQTCLTCPPYSSGEQCQTQEENCFSFMNPSPIVSASSTSSSELVYKITLPNILQRSANVTIFSFSNINTCDSSTNSIITNSTELQFNSTRKLSCDTEYTLTTSMETLMKDSRVTKQLDSSGVVLTLTVPIFVALQSNVEDYCQITNYQVNHQIKLLLSSHQYINMGVISSNSTVSLSFRREVLSISNKKLSISGKLFAQNLIVEGVLFDRSEPHHNVSFSISIQPSSNGVYSLTIHANEELKQYSGVFTFNVFVRDQNGQVHQLPLSISLSYYMPIDPPSTEFKLSSKLSLYTDNFREAKNLFLLSEKPHIVVNVVDSEGKAGVLQGSVKISIKNAYMCCVGSDESMPPFDLQQSQYGCTRYNPLLMKSWFHLIQTNSTGVSPYDPTIIKFPFVNNQIAFNFKLSYTMFPNSTIGTVSNCFIHTETVLVNDAQSARRTSLTVTATSIQETYNSYDIIQIFNNQPVQPTTPLTSQKVLNGSAQFKYSSWLMMIVMVLTYIIV